ncbi:hypothetical protein K7X08_015333 [Anisodus acutangulus]|uniref:Reticulon-like protein n=1 Tax=Anisodus acutangulus TaxID=402998 RepID=A0A9Q1QVF5_9SOLA|nr:hypothetical protein K7X08_015333 [Anisodus acutangulus]
MVEWDGGVFWGWVGEVNKVINFKKDQKPKNRNILLSFRVLGFIILDKRSQSKVPRLVLPVDLFINIAKTIGAEINHGLGFLQDVSAGGNLKQFAVVVLSLWAAGMIGSWCNFLTVLYIGFIAAHTLPVLYERYEDEVDGFVYNALDKLQGHYKKLDSGVLSRIPRRSFRGKKVE